MTKQNVALMLPLLLLGVLVVWAVVEHILGVRSLKASERKKKKEEREARARAARAAGHRRRGHGRGHDANLSIEVARLNASAKAMQEAKRKEREHEAELMWVHASRLCFILDLFYPFVTRTILQHWQCVDLGNDQLFLEADMREEMMCGGEWWNRRLPVVVVMAIIYCLGIPALFLWVVHHLLGRHHRARHTSFVLRRRMSSLHADLVTADGDPAAAAAQPRVSRGTHMMVAAAKMAHDNIVVEKANVKAFAWMYEPYKQNTVWWVGPEMLRRLLLSSCMGLIGGSYCNVKTVAALLISLGYALAFLTLKPYRKASDNALQAVATAMPILMMAYATSSLKLVDEVHDALAAEQAAERTASAHGVGTAKYEAAMKSAAAAGEAADVYETQAMMVLSMHLLVVVPFVAGICLIVVATIALIFKEATSKKLSDEQLSLADALLDDDEHGREEDDDHVLSDARERLSTLRHRGGGSSSSRRESGRRASHLLGAKKLGAQKTEKQKKQKRDDQGGKDPKVAPVKDASSEAGDKPARHSSRRSSISGDSAPSTGIEVKKKKRKSRLRGATDAVRVARKSKNKKDGKKRKRKRSMAEQHQLIKEAFLAIDSNGDGSWTLEEFEAVCNSDDQEGVATLFAMFDRDGSGEVDLRELTRTLRTNEEAKRLAMAHESLRGLVKQATKGANRRSKRTKSRMSKAKGKSKVRRRNTKQATGRRKTQTSDPRRTSVFERLQQFKEEAAEGSAGGGRKGTMVAIPEGVDEANGPRSPRPTRSPRIMKVSSGLEVARALREKARGAAERALNASAAGAAAAAAGGGQEDYVGEEDL